VDVVVAGRLVRIERADAHAVRAAGRGDDLGALGAVAAGRSVDLVEQRAVGRAQLDDDVDALLLHDDVRRLAAPQFHVVRVGAAG
jgi:hypothetical protein